jgi:hypothetical protein
MEATCAGPCSVPHSPVMWRSGVHLTWIMLCRCMWAPGQSVDVNV